MADLLRIYLAVSPPPEKVYVSSKNWPANYEPPCAIPTSNGSSLPSCSCCCTRFTCMLCTILAVVAFTFVAGAVAGIMYLIFRFKIPNYSINRLTLSAFKVDGNLTVGASFVVTITADNPNAKMGIYYLDGSRLSAFYNDNSLVSGSFPVFYQGHRNTTVIDVVVSGEAPLSGPLVTALRQQQRDGAAHHARRRDGAGEGRKIEAVEGNGGAKSKCSYWHFIEQLQYQV